MLSHSTARDRVPRPRMLIGGSWVERSSGGVMTHVDPATGEILGEFLVAGPEEIDAAVRAAKLAFPAWKRMPADRRRALLLRVAELVGAAADDFKTLVALETGTPIGVSASFGKVVDFFQYYAGWCDKFAGEVNPTYPRRALDYTLYEPYGVVGALATWNSPIVTAAMKLAPALAAGNCVVLKASELGPFALMRLAELCEEAGLPEGVLSLVTGGAATGEAIIRHPDVRKVSFTGGPSTAVKVMSTAAESLTPVTLELGGKSANVVFDDADLDAAALMAAQMSTIASAGQGCLYPTRLLVQERVYDDVVSRVRAVAESRVIGDPLDPAVNMGPVISASACERILGYIEEAKAGDARLVTGGRRLDGELAGGNFIEPTVFAEVDNSTRLAQDEIFGPVLAVIRFRDEAEAVRLANDTRFGLAAFVHTRDLVRAHRVADDLEAGYIGINSFPPMVATTPFGGTKRSGFGREGGRAGIEEYVHHKNVYVPLD
jgi:aldehyde dehydrogenase (NAD+)